MQEKGLASYLDMPGVLMLSLDSHGIIDYVNTNGCKMVGYKQKEMIGLNWFDIFIPAAKRKTSKNLFKKIIFNKIKVVNTYENTVLHKNGSELTFLWHYNLIKDKKGKITGVLSTGNDITNNFIVENELRIKESYAKVRAQIWKLASDTSLTEKQLIKNVLCLAGPVMKVNRASFNSVENNMMKCTIEWSDKTVKSLIGSEIPEYLAMKIINKKIVIYTPESVSKMKHMSEFPASKLMIDSIFKRYNITTTLGIPLYINGRLEGSISFDICHNNIYKKGWTPEDMQIAGEIEKIISSAISLKKSEIEAKSNQLKNLEVENKFRALFEYAPEAYYIFDMKGIFIDVNLAGEKMTGYKLEELIGKSFFDTNIITQDQQHKVSADISKNAAGKEAGPTQYMLLRKNGTSTRMEMKSYPINFTGKTLILGTAKDITDAESMEIEREILDETFELFTSGRELDEIFTLLPKLLSQKLKFPIAAVALYDEENEGVIYIGSVGISTDNEILKVPMEQSLAGTVIKSGQPLYISDASRRKEYVTGTLKKLQILTFMGVPVKSSGKTIAAIILADSKNFREQGRVFELLKNIANNLSQNIEKNRAIEALRKSEEKYRNIANYTHDWEYWVDVKGKLIYCSPACEKITGYKPEEISNIHDFMHKILHHDFLEIYNQYELDLLTKDDISIDIKIVRKNGRDAWINHSCRKVYDSLGNAMGMRGSDREITEKVIIENILQESESKYKSLFNNAGDAIFLYYPGDSGETGHFIDVNNTACEWLGYTKEEFFNITADQISEPNQSKNKDTNSKNYSGEKNGVIEGELITKDGKKIQVEITTHSFLMSGDKVVMSVARDITLRKKTEESLKEREMQYRSLFENLKDGFSYHKIILDDDGNPIDYIFVELNQAFESILGLKKEMVIGKTAKEIMPGIEKDAFDWIGTYGTVALTGRAVKFETYNEVMKKWFNVSVYSNRRGYFATVFEDVTDRRKIVEKMNMLSTAMEQSANVVVITDTKGNITYVNPKFTEVTGYEAHEAIGKNPKILKSGYSSEHDYKNMWNTLTAGNVWRGRFQNKKKNGKLFWEAATITPVKNEAGLITSYIAINEDITAIKEAEEQAGESQSMLFDFLENANDMIQIVRPDFTFEYVNKKWLETLGYTSEQLFKMNLFDVVETEEKKNFAEVYAKMTTGDGEHSVDTVFVAADNRKIIVEGSLNCFVESGNAIHTRAILRDVTDKRKAERELLANYEKLKEVDVMKSNFTAMISHELRTPLTAIKGFTSFLLGDAAGAINSKQREFVTVIKNNSDRLLNLINEILDISKMESGTFSILKKKQEVITIVDKAVNDIASVAERKKLILDKIFAQENIEAEIDEYRISQVVLNLLNNAIKFSPDNGHIITGVELIVCGQIKVPNYAGFKGEKGSEGIHIWVKDQGVGIDDFNVDKVFDRFYQVSDQDQRIFKGVGLGLNISKNIVEAHGGAIWAESDGRGKGSVFHVILPA